MKEKIEQIRQQALAAIEDAAALTSLMMLKLLSLVKKDSYPAC